MLPPVSLTGTAAPASFVDRHGLWCAALVLALMTCNVLLGLGTSNVNDYDEARYVVTAFEMQQHRAFVLTTYGEQREALGYWLMALSFSLFGGSALAMRLPSALCALAAVAVTMAAARRWFDGRRAVLAGAILATTFGFLSHHGARSGDFDAGLTLVLLLVAVQLPGIAESPWRVVPVALLFACGFLLKSFAIAPMVLVAAGYLAWTGAWRRLRLVPSLAALGLFALIVGTWAFARWRADGSPDFFLRMFREDVVGRSTSIVDKSTSSPFGYLAGIFDRFAPWPVLMLAAASVALRAGGTRRPLWPLRPRRPEITRLLVLWIGVPLVFFSLVRTQHHWYLDPTYPALAMVAAGCALFLVERTPPRRRTLAIAALVALPLALCEARLLARVLLGEPMSADQRFLRGLTPAAAGCREIRTTCRLAHSERFLLEVADGVEVVEPGQAPPAAAGAAVLRTAPARSPADAACLLVGKLAWRLPPAPPPDRLPPRDRLFADSAGYALYRGTGAGTGIGESPPFRAVR